MVRSFAKSPDCADTRIGSLHRIVRSVGGSDSQIGSIRSITRSVSDGSFGFVRFADDSSVSDDVEDIR